MAKKRRSRGRPVDGILLLNKPAGKTSNDALQIAKSLYFAAKAGHTGSLDPLATGLLPVCFGEATKFSQFLLDSNKRYLVQAKLGVITDSGDADGEILETREVPAISDERFTQVAHGYTGDIEQTPSMFSAIKHEGQPLYKLARQGIEVERKSRQITIFSIDVTSFDGEYFELEVYCSKGTYIRSLVEDIGLELGCGAHVTRLHRTQVGPYSIEHMKTLDELGALKTSADNLEHANELLDGLLLPVQTSVDHWPTIELSENTAYYIQQGQSVQCPDAPEQGWVSILQGGEFLGVGEVLDDGRVTPRRMVKT